MYSPQASEDSEISGLFLVHLIGDKSVEGAITVKNEITNIQNVLKKRSLDVISVPLPNLMSLRALHGADGDIDQSFKEELHSYFTKNFDELVETCDKSTNLGVDVTTEWLASATEKEVTLLLSAIENFNESRNSTVAVEVEGSNGTRKIKCLSVATNSYTHKHLNNIHAWAVQKG